MEILVEGLLDYFEEKSWKKRYFVMKYEISSALRYIEVYKDKNWHRQLPRHVVNLHPGYEVRRREEPKKKHSFSVKTTDHTLLLACDDENVITHWMATLEEYNLVKSFCVQPQDTPTMVRIEAVFPCHLQLVHSEVRLVSAMDGKLLGLWPFKCIRRYKFVGNLFSIEAGRKAPTGEGVFEFISNECAEIYRVMDTIIRTKAGNTTMRRLASEKLHNQVEQIHHPIRKTHSVPMPPTKKEPRYEYADPTPGPTVSRPPPPRVPIPSPPPPVESPPELPLHMTEPTYDMLSPGTEGAVNESDAKLAKPSEPASNENEYNTLQFANAQQVESEAPVPNRKPTMTGSPGRYDTLHFNTSPDTSSTGHDFIKDKAKGGDYDTLQFGRDTLSHPTDDTLTAKNDSELQHGSGCFYNTLDRLNPSQTSGSVRCTSDTYDTLDAGKKPHLGGTDTYDSLGNTTREVKPPTSLDLGNTYDAVQHETKKPAGKSSPFQAVSPPRPSIPVRPPPRKKVPPVPRQPEVPMKKMSPGGKPEIPVRKNIPAKEGKDEPRQSISDVIQKRLAMPKPVGDDNYSSADHEYTAIDYSKVSISETKDSDIYADPDQDDKRGAITKPSKKTVQNPPATTGSSDIYTDPDQDDRRGAITKPSKKTVRNPPATTESSDIYTDPDQDDTRGTTVAKAAPRPVKPSRPGKNLFKKTSPSPKPKLDTGSNFTDELKKKLEVKLKKTGEAGHKTATSIPVSRPSNDDIYCEVDDTYAPTYSEPCV